MPRSIDVPALKTRSVALVSEALDRYKTAVGDNLDHLLLRWIAQMTAVEINATWEVYVERRLVAALNHYPSHFVSSNKLLGVRRISAGLAGYIVRGGKQYVDIRGSSDLQGRANLFLSRSRNPFQALSSHAVKYIDALSAVRNHIVHRSNSSEAKYKKVLRDVYNVRSAPAPDEFLHARDYRRGSPARYESRLQGMTEVLLEAIRNT
jgi:hypothetical protein